MFARRSDVMEARLISGVEKEITRFHILRRKKLEKNGFGFRMIVNNYSPKWMASGGLFPRRFAARQISTTSH